MDLETTARMLYLVEATDKGRTAYSVKRCVYAIAKKDGGGRAALNKAFAICVAQAQKSGDLKKGSMETTKAGAKDSTARKKTKSKYGFTLKRYERELKKGRQTESFEHVSLLEVYVDLHEELQIEMYGPGGPDVAGFKKNLSQARKELVTLDSALVDESVVPLPGVLAKLVTLTIGRKGVMGVLGIHGLLGAVGLANTSEMTQGLEVMVKTFRNVLTANVNWAKAKSKVKAMLSVVSQIGSAKEDGNPDPEKIVSLLTDLFILLGQLVQLFADGIDDKRAKNAAVVVRYDLRDVSAALMMLA